MEIDMGKLPFDIDFHPSNPLVTAGLITGHLLLLLEAHAHSESCRAVRFINEGRGIVTGSPDCSILATDVETGSAIARLENSHGAAVNRITNLTESTIASGDGEGCIKVWDTRQRTCSNSFNAHEEYISDMTFAFDSMRLLGTSDRYVDLSPNSVDALLKLDEDRVISGSENGLIRQETFSRGINCILPNRIIQPIAEHSEYPVERLGTMCNCPWPVGSFGGAHVAVCHWTVRWLMSCSIGFAAFSHGKKLLGSISHGSYIEDSDSDEMDEMDMDMDMPSLSS
ncbi:hypothetical protein TEA_028351 [Camellia sinensis var. sinensis]|uniref:Uncharacterized protein n=1 Tax=Camellia sinensis var. sinensis TaxID=542762 RepID=A0A4S4E905_CAMSN|nr:hypothetical protein TEA_028351 [Camellia sinensis var. sinensis]